MRKKTIVIIYAVAVFLIIFLITFNTVCSVSQFEVVYDAGSPDMIAKAEQVQNELEERYLRKNYLFFEEENVYSTVAEIGGGYLEVTSVKKVFPNKISVSVKEKYEAYTFVSGGKYYVVGDDGTVLSVSDKNENNIEGRNIEIVGIEFNTPQVGDKFTVTESFTKAYAALRTFINEVNARGLRGNILRIEYGTDGGNTDQWFDNSWFLIDTVEGVRIQIIDPERNDMSAKAKLALDVYDTLKVIDPDTGEAIELGPDARMNGYIHVTDRYEHVGNTVEYRDTTVIYSPNDQPDLDKIIIQ